MGSSCLLGLLFLVFFALGLQFLEFLGVLPVWAAQAVFLPMQVLKVPGLLHENVSVQQMTIFEQVGIAHPAQGEDSIFKTGDAVQALLGVGQVLD